eukprot:scaffold44602_cov18-Tisochrysis_lutea.AAC.1
MRDTLNADEHSKCNSGAAVIMIHAPESKSQSEGDTHRAFLRLSHLSPHAIQVCKNKEADVLFGHGCRNCRLVAVQSAMFIAAVSPLNWRLAAS